MELWRHLTLTVSDASTGEKEQKEREARYAARGFSMTREIPWPPPMHMVMSA